MFRCGLRKSDGPRDQTFRVLLEIRKDLSPRNSWRVFAAVVGNPALTTALETVNHSWHYKG